MLRQEKKEARSKKVDCDPSLEDLHKVKSPSFQIYSSESYSQDRPVYVFRLRLLDVKGRSEGAARMVKEPSYLNRELFRDVAVYESAGIYEFALIITCGPVELVEFHLTSPCAGTHSTSTSTTTSPSIDGRISRAALVAAHARSLHL